MNTIKCDFCKKENRFSDKEIVKSGKAMIITCSECKRRITVGFNGQEYFERKDEQ